MKPPFEKLVERSGGVVLRVCRVMLSAHDAEDAWSETFLAALRAYPELPDDANAEAWLVTIARRKAIDVLRARKRQPAPSVRYPRRRPRSACRARRTATCGRRSRRCRTSSARRWLTTTSRAWRTPRSPASSGGQATRRAGPPPTA